MRNLIIFSLIFALGYQCRKKEVPQNENTIVELRDIYDSYIYNYFDTVNWQKNHEQLEKKYSGNPNKSYKEATNIARRILWRIPEKERLRFLDSLETSGNFHTYHLYNQYLVYYFKSRLYTQIQNHKKAIEYAIKAEEITGNDWESFDVEKSKIRELMFGSVLQHSLLSKKIIEINGEYVDKLIESKKNPDFELFSGIYKIALSYYNEKEYQLSLDWINKFSNLNFNIKNVRSYANMMSLKLQNFEKLNLRDSIIALNEKMKNEYKQKTMETYPYNLYRVSKFTSDAYMISPEYALKSSDSLLEIFVDQCRNKEERIKIFDGRSKIYENKGKKAEAKKELLKAYKEVSGCKESESSFLIEERKIIDRVMANLDKGNDSIDYEKLIDRKEEIDSSLTVISESFLELNDYFAKKENKNQKIRSNLELKKSKQKHLMNFIILAILLMLVCGVAYLLLMHRKVNLSKKEIIEKKSQLKLVQNQIKLKNNNLKNLKEQMESRNTRLKNFAYRGAKDIKSPIITIQRNLDKISELYAPVFNIENAKIIEYLQSSTRELGVMIETLLEYSTKEKNIVKNEKVNIVNLLNRVKANLDSQVVLNNAEITIPMHIPYITANKALIEKLFQNIIANALKYHRDEIPPMIEISYEILNEQFVKFTIQDNGLGIPNEKLEQVFEIFYQVDREKQFEGNGIGLSVCRKIVLEFGGNIWVESELNKGSKFHFTLPLTEDSTIVNQKADKNKLIL